MSSHNVTDIDLLALYTSFRRRPNRTKRIVTRLTVSGCSRHRHQRTYLIMGTCQIDILARALPYQSYRTVFNTRGAS